MENLNLITVYVDADRNGCSDLVFTLGNAGIGAAITTRQWSIKVLLRYD